SGQTRLHDLRATRYLHAPRRPVVGRKAGRRQYSLPVARLAFLPRGRTRRGRSCSVPRARLRRARSRGEDRAARPSRTLGFWQSLQQQPPDETARFRYWHAVWVCELPRSANMRTKILGGVAVLGVAAGVAMFMMQTHSTPAASHQAVRADAFTPSYSLT